MVIRKIRDWLNGSSSNTGNHWIEIQLINTSGTNAALSKVANCYYSSGVIASLTNGTYITDGDAATVGNYAYGPDGIPCYIEIDLGADTDINTIKIWHYYGDNRYYNGTKVQIYSDALGKWIDIFDSAISGRYKEYSVGFTIDVSGTNKVVYDDQVITADFYNQLRTDLLTYYAASAGAASSTTSPLPVATTTNATSNAIVATTGTNSVQQCINDIKELYTTLTGTSRLSNFEYSSSGAASTSTGETITSEKLNNIRRMLDFMNNTNCYVCVSSTFTCVACNSCVSCNTCQTACYTTTYNTCTACVTTCKLCYSSNSLRILKENIIPFNDSAVDIINNTPIYSFNYKSDEEKNKKVGIIADDTNELIATKKHDRLDEYNSIGLLFKAVQELYKENIELKERLKTLEEKK